MGRSGEITKDVKENIISHHKSGKGYKSIAKLTGLHKSTVRSIIRKWKTLGTVLNLPRSGRPAKISPSAELTLITEVTKNPTITTKELQASLASTKVNVHGATIRRTLKVLGFERVAETDRMSGKEAESCGSESEANKVSFEEFKSGNADNLTDKVHVKVESESFDSEGEIEKVCVKEETLSCDSENETDTECTKEDAESCGFDQNVLQK